MNDNPDKKNEIPNFNGGTTAIQKILLVSVPWAIIIYFGFYF